MPDAPAKRRWFQFRLRTLFVVGALVGVVCWFGLNVVQVIERQLYRRMAGGVTRDPIRRVDAVGGNQVYPTPPFNYDAFAELHERRRTAASQGRQGRQPPWIWTLLGVTPVNEVSLYCDATDRDVRRVMRLFPEATVIIDRYEVFGNDLAESDLADIERAVFALPQVNRKFIVEVLGHNEFYGDHFEPLKLVILWDGPGSQNHQTVTAQITDSGWIARDVSEVRGSPAIRRQPRMTSNAITLHQ